MNTDDTKSQTEVDEKPDTAASADVETDEAQTSTDDTSADNSTDTRETELTLEERLAAAVQDRNTNLDQFMRAQAELENFRKRSQKEAEQNRLYYVVSLIRDLLPGLDNLQRAIEAAGQTGNVDELVQGVQMVAKQFENVLGQHKVVPIEAVGLPFDPNLHEAIQQIPSADHEPMTVIQEIERGYKLEERVIRPAKVIVSCAPPAESTSEPD